MNSNVTPLVRRAVPEDISAILALIDELAAYERLDGPDSAARERLSLDLFGPNPRAECHLVFMDGYPVGYIIVFETYSSFRAQPTFYIEDIFVLSEYRSRGAGFALFQRAQEEARARGCARMEWTVLNWNNLAREFYLKLGAKHMEGWQLFRLELS